MDKLIEYVCDELDAIEKKVAKSGNLSASDVEYADKLAHLKKNLMKAEEYGMSYARGGDYSNANAYNGDMMGGYYSNARNGRGRQNARRDSMGRYSRDGADLADQLRELMDETEDEDVRRDIKRLMHKVEQSR